MTVRDRIAEIQRAMRDEEIPPSRAREYAIDLAGLMGNVSHEVVDAELAYNAVLAQLFAEEAKANRAQVRAMATPEYARLRTAKETQKLVSLMRATLNTVLRSLIEEGKAIGA